MSGTQRSHFEGHLAAICGDHGVRVQFMRNSFSYFDLYTYSTPLFDTWSAEFGSSQDDWSFIPTASDMEPESDSQSKEDRHPVNDSIGVISDSDIPPNKPVRSKAAMPDAMTTSQVLSLFECSCSLSSDDPDRTLTEDMPKESKITIRRKKKPQVTASNIVEQPQQSTSTMPMKSAEKKKSKTKMRTDKVMHPKGYEEETPQPQKGDKEII